MSVPSAMTVHLDVDLTGPMPTRERLGLAPGRTQRTWTGDDGGPVAVTYRLAGDRGFTVPARMVTVSTTSQAVTTPRRPEAADELMPPNEVAATQDVEGRDHARELLLERAHLLGLDRADVERWAATAPEAPGPRVLLAKHFFAGRSRIGYVDVSVGVFIADLAYVVWDLSWDPPVPGFVYGPGGVLRPTAS